MEDIDMLLDKIDKSPVSFWDIYDYKFDLIEDHYSGIYPKRYVAEGNNKVQEWIAKGINWLFYPERDGEVYLDTLLEARFIPKKSYYKYEVFNNSKDLMEPIEEVTIKIDPIRYNYHLSPMEYNDKKVFDFMGIEIWKTDWEIPYKQSQIEKFKEDVMEAIKEKIN